VAKIDYGLRGHRCAGQASCGQNGRWRADDARRPGVSRVRPVATLTAVVVDFSGGAGLRQRVLPRSRTPRTVDVQPRPARDHRLRQEVLPANPPFAFSDRVSGRQRGIGPTTIPAGPARRISQRGLFAFPCRAGDIGDLPASRKPLRLRRAGFQRTTAAIGLVFSASPCSSSIRQKMFKGTSEASGTTPGFPKDAHHSQDVEPADDADRKRPPSLTDVAEVGSLFQGGSAPDEDSGQDKSRRAKGTEALALPFLISGGATPARHGEANWDLATPDVEHFGVAQ